MCNDPERKQCGYSQSYAWEIKTVQKSFVAKSLKLIKLLAMYPECHHDNNNILISVFPSIMSLMKGILATGLDLLNYLQRFYD